MKKLFFIFLFALSILSCTKEETVQPVEVKQQCYLILMNGMIEPGLIGYVVSDKTTFIRVDPVSTDTVKFDNGNTWLKLYVIKNTGDTVSLNRWEYITPKGGIENASMINFSYIGKK